MSDELFDRLRSAYKEAIEFGHSSIVAIHVGDDVWYTLREMARVATPFDKWADVVAVLDVSPRVWGIPMVREMDWHGDAIEVRARKVIA